METTEAMNPTTNRARGTPCHAPRRRSAPGIAARVVLFAAVLLGGGCALTPDGSREALATGGAADRLAASDLVGVIARALPPRDTTVQVGRDNDDPLVALLSDVLIEQGFGIQRVTADQGAWLLDHSRDVEWASSGEGAIDWRLAVGPVEVRRNYTLTDEGELRTAGPLRLSGSRADIAADATAPPGLVVADAAHRRVRYVASLDLEGPGPVISLVTPAVVEQVARTASSGRRRAGPSAQALNANHVEINNLFYTGESNFVSALDDLERVGRRIIVFADDSMKLGEPNKLLIDEFIEKKVRGGDVISLVGCSNGPTALAIGNEGLALGRAARVTEALTARGIPRDRIYDEGCWAPVSAGEKFPGRGVVLELWRRSA